MRYYNIAEVTIAVDSDLPITDSTFAPKFTSFEVAAPGDDVVSIHHRFQIPLIPEKDLKHRVYQKTPWAIYKTETSWLYTGIFSASAKKPFFQVAVFNQDHSSGTIYHGPPQKEAFINGDLKALTLFPTDQVLLARVMADRDAFFIHAAGIVQNGEGFLFVGHSDAGKSTVCQMFQDRGGKILCDDRIVVRKHSDGYKIHGTWSHGDVPDCCPDAAPLRGIYFLEQAPENEIIPMEDLFSSIQRLLPCLIKGLVTPDWLNKSLHLIEALAREVPCFRLRFDKSGKIVIEVSSKL